MLWLIDELSCVLAIYAVFGCCFTPAFYVLHNITQFCHLLQFFHSLTADKIAANKDCSFLAHIYSWGDHTSEKTDKPQQWILIMETWRKSR